MGLGVGALDGLGVGALVGLGVGALVGLGVGALVGLGVGALVGLGVGVSVGFELSDVFGVAVSGGSNVGVSETSGVGVSDASGVGVSEASGVGVSDCSGVRVGVGVSFFPEPLCESSLSGKEEALAIGFSGKTKLADKIIDSNAKSMIVARNRLMHLNNFECLNSYYSCFSVYQLLIVLRVPAVPTSAQAARV